MKKTMANEGKEKEKEKEKAAVAATKTTFATVAKVVAMVSIFPAVAFLPFVLSRICTLVERGPAHTLIALWVAYGVLEASAVLWIRRGRHTLDSWATQHTVHVIFSLGAYHFLSVAQRVPPAQRRDALWVWLTITMAANIVFSFVDGTDHAAKAREELEKQKRKEERRKLRAAERAAGKEKKKTTEKREPFWKSNKLVKFTLDAVVYVALAAAVAWIAWSLWQYSVEFNARKAGTSQNEHHWGYESTTGLDHKPKEVEDYELEEATTGPSKIRSKSEL